MLQTCRANHVYLAMQMMLEVQRMHDEVLECKADVAISSNRLTRLDNPIVHDKLRTLRREAEQAVQEM